ncbi:hypothetical protein ACGFYT_28460 [Streptomyces sp. NPDC048208]|uniref:hypothetical protein n=1 Tax=Streptomyces sp. NPDC048208 TaxID=3365515 RepID=UPI00372175BC
MECWKAIAPLVGVVLGSLGTLLGQKLSDTRTLRPDRLLAQEEAKFRLATERAALQREAIMEIQHGLEGIMAANELAPGQRASAASSNVRPVMMRCLAVRGGRGGGQNDHVAERVRVREIDDDEGRR